MISFPFLTFNTMVLHGAVPTQKQFEIGYDYVLKMLRRKFRCHPTTVYVSTPHVKKSDLTTPWDKWEKDVSRFGLPEDLLGITLYVEYPLTFIDKIGVAIRSADRALTLAFDVGVKKFDRQYLADIARDIHTVYPFTYGYALMLPRNKFPIDFGSGRFGGQGKSSDIADLDLRNSRWAKFIRNIVRTGVELDSEFRDIYPLNFLSGGHLERNVGNMSLKEWIHCDVSRGRLTHLDNAFWVWEIDASQVCRVRNELIAEDLLIACRD